MQKCGSKQHILFSFRFKKWLPDNVASRHDTKTTYQVEIRYANNTNETFTFHGPPGADEIPGPVKWTRPYFDCGRSNRWLVAAVVPIADIYPRHTGFRHVEYPTYVTIIQFFIYIISGINSDRKTTKILTCCNTKIV